MLLPRHIQGGQTLLQPGEHPFPTTYAIERSEMRIEPNIYLDALMHDFIDFGGRIVIRRFTTPRDVAALPENLIVNCTGLGAKALLGDEELVPLRACWSSWRRRTRCTTAPTAGWTSRRRSATCSST